MNAQRPSSEIASELIANLSQPPEWGEAFRSVKFDTNDGDDESQLRDRWIVIVAKGEDADRLAAAYDGGTA